MAKDNTTIEDYHRIALLSTAAGRKVLVDMIARSKLLSGLLTEADIPVANFVVSILNRCGLFGCIKDRGGIHYHESLDSLVEKLQELPYENKRR